MMMLSKMPHLLSAHPDPPACLLRHGGDNTKATTIYPSHTTRCHLDQKQPRPPPNIRGLLACHLCDEEGNQRITTICPSLTVRRLLALLALTKRVPLPSIAPLHQCADLPALYHASPRVGTIWQDEEDLLVLQLQRLTAKPKRKFNLIELAPQPARAKSNAPKAPSMGSPLRTLMSCISQTLFRLRLDLHQLKALPHQIQPTLSTNHIKMNQVPFGPLIQKK